MTRTRKPVVAASCQKDYCVPKLQAKLWPDLRNRLIQNLNITTKANAVLIIRVLWDVKPSRLVNFIDVSENCSALKASAAVYYLTRHNIPEDMSLLWIILDIIASIFSDPVYLDCL
jgi:hypothetical protein